jgi:hypothetical protein
VGNGHGGSGKRVMLDPDVDYAESMGKPFVLSGEVVR